MSSKKILVAGASRGIRLAVAEHLAPQSRRLLAVSRTAARFGEWVQARLLTLYPLAHKSSCRKCVDYFCGKTAGTDVFPQTKKNTNNFSKKPLKTHKVNSLGSGGFIEFSRCIKSSECDWGGLLGCIVIYGRNLGDQCIYK
jgi:hypothetical protein